MIATVVAIVACLLILGVTAYALVWVTLVDRQVMSELDAEVRSRSTSGPVRVHRAVRDEYMGGAS